MARCIGLRVSLSCVVLFGASLSAFAAPPAGHGKHAAHLQAQVKDINTRIASARTHNAALQSQVSRMEQQAAAQRTQLQQRDAEIAALHKKLQAAGVPAGAGSAGR